MDPAWRAAKQLRDTRIHAAKIVRLYAAKHQSRGWNGSNRVGGNYNGVP
jgi:endonuclease I